MSRNSKVGGTKRRVLDVVGFTAIIVLFLLYMVPLSQKRDIHLQTTQKHLRKWNS